MLKTAAETKEKEAVEQPAQHKVAQEYCPTCGKPIHSKLDLKKEELKQNLKETIKKDPIKFIAYGLIALIVIKALLFG